MTAVECAPSEQRSNAKIAKGPQRSQRDVSILSLGTGARFRMVNETSLGDRINAVSHKIVGAAIAVHREVGPGLLEKTYKLCLKRELELAGLQVFTEVPVAIVYRDLVVERAYFIDLLVEGLVAVEVKGVTELGSAQRAQVLTQLRWADLRLGLLLNFHAERMKEGIRRIVHDLPEVDREA